MNYKADSASPHLISGTTEGVLQGGDVFEAVAGHDSVVVVRGDEQHGGVAALGPRRDVVQRRDAAQPRELLRLVAAAVVAHPGVAHRELLEPEEVHHPATLQDYDHIFRTIG